MSDRHIRILRGAAKRLRTRLTADRAEEHDDGSPGAARRDDLERASAVANARLAAAEARRANPTRDHT
jgi:hypothetical protein